MRTTRYFKSLQSRPDRVFIKMAWIERVVANPEDQLVQNDGRVRVWGRIAEMDGRYLRVVLLSDRKTVHNAFFDRGFSL